MDGALGIRQKKPFLCVLSGFLRFNTVKTFLSPEKITSIGLLQPDKFDCSLFNDIGFIFNEIISVTEMTT